MNLGARGLGLNSDSTSPKRLSHGNITDHSELQLPHLEMWDKHTHDPRVPGELTRCVYKAFYTQCMLGSLLLARFLPSHLWKPCKSYLLLTCQ